MPNVAARPRPKSPGAAGRRTRGPAPREPSSSTLTSAPGGAPASEGAAAVTRVTVYRVIASVVRVGEAAVGSGAAREPALWMDGGERERG